MGEPLPPEAHAPMIAGFSYRGVLVCRRCVLAEEATMAGRFYDWNGVRGSGWTCDRCGVELEHQVEQLLERYRAALREIADYGEQYAHRTQHLKALALIARSALRGKAG